jgi:hypothetical protein
MRAVVKELVQHIRSEETKKLNFAVRGFHADLIVDLLKRICRNRIDVPEGADQN